MSDAIKVWERLEWAHSGELAITDRFALILNWFVKESDLQGRFTAFISAWAGRTRYDEEELEKAIEFFLGLGLLTYFGKDPRTAFPIYELVHGASVTPQQLTFDQHGMIELIEKLPDISDAEQLVLEKLVMRHFDWAEGVVVATTADLDKLSGRWTSRWRERLIRRLVDRGYLTRKHRRGYRNSPHTYTLVLPTPPDETSDEASLNTPNRSLSAPSNTPDRSLSAPSNTPDQSLSERSILIEKNKEKNEEELTTTTASAVAAEDTDSVFVLRVWELSEGDAAAFMWAADLEEQSGGRWHSSRADELLDDFQNIRANPGALNPMGVLRSEWQRKIKYVDLRTPSTVDLSPQPEEFEERNCWTGDHWICRRVGCGCNLDLCMTHQDATPSSQALDIWNRALEQIKERVTSVVYEVDFADTFGLAWREGELVVVCSSAHMATRLHEHLYGVIVRSVTEVCEVDVDVRFAVLQRDSENQ